MTPCSATPGSGNDSQLCCPRGRSLWISASQVVDTAAEDDHDPHDANLADLVAHLAIPDWHADAACREYDPAWWFPTRGQTGTRAEIVCSGCLVRDECEAWALTEQPEAGIWAGMSARAIRRGVDA